MNIGKIAKLLLLDIVAENTVDADIHKAMGKKEKRSNQALSRTSIAMMRERAKNAKTV